MASVHVRHFPERDLVIFQIEGVFSPHDLLSAADRHFHVHASSRTIWDLRLADFSDISVADMRVISRRSTEMAQARSRPRSALVASDDVKRIVLKLYEAITESDRNPVSYRIFDTIAEAEAWLHGEEPGDAAGAGTTD